MTKLVYVKAKPVTVEHPLAPPMAFVEVGGQRIDQPICQATDDGNGVPVWAAVVDDDTHAAILAEPNFLGAGLNEVFDKDPDIYHRITVQEVNNGKGGRKVVPMGEAIEVGEVVTKTRPGHTFGGWDPMTGNPS